MQIPEQELYSFEVKTVKEVEKTTVVVDEATKEETKITKKVKEETPVRIVIKRPTRRQVEKADVQYATKLSEYMRAGILTRAMVTKKYADTGGVLTEDEAKYLTSRYKKLADIQKDFVNLSVKIDVLTEEQKQKLGEVTEEINQIRKEIAEIESNYSFIFQHTADMKASNHVILFYSLVLTYIEDNKDDKPELTPFFKGSSFEDKLDDFYAKEESGDLFYLQVMQKLKYFMAFWYNGAIASKDDFVKLEKDIDSGQI